MISFHSPCAPNFSSSISLRAADAVIRYKYSNLNSEHSVVSASRFARAAQSLLRNNEFIGIARYYVSFAEIEADRVHQSRPIESGKENRFPFRAPFDERHAERVVAVERGMRARADRSEEFQ